jgi:hypothetical protein
MVLNSSGSELRQFEELSRVPNARQMWKFGTGGSFVVIVEWCTESDNGWAHGAAPAVWPGAPGSGPGVMSWSGDGTVGQAAVPQTCAGAVRVVMPRGA